MRRLSCLALLASAVSATSPDAAHAQPEPRRTLYTVATAHLDTQWLWTIQKTIDEYLPKTLDTNLRFMRQYPDYVFSFEGAFRYQLMKEYYPQQFEEMRRRIAEGRWQVTGSWVDAVDPNIPSPESLMRQALYGNGYWRREFGKSSVDVFLPDCFGFGYALPSVAAHCGITGFGTQKLTWGSAYGIPFNIGVWRGVDGSEVVASLDPGGYGSDAGADWNRSDWIKGRIDKTGQASGAYVDLRYHGTGDTGGGPSAKSMQNLDLAMKESGPIRVLSAGADQLFRDLTPSQRSRLPRYDGELLMTTHGTGCYTSQTAMKEWNRRNEQLADAAERAAVGALWLAGMPYPAETLRNAWVRFLWHQFHDDLTGTSIPEAYEFSWNDEVLSLNQFSDVLTSSVAAWCSALDTRGAGTPVVVYNPSWFSREELVEALVPTRERAYQAVGPNGRACDAEILGRSSQGTRVAFRAQAPSSGLAVYRIIPAPGQPPRPTARSRRDLLENDRLRVRIDANGDVWSIFDKKLGVETLAAPVRLELLDNESRDWAAWEIKYAAVAKKPRSYVGQPESWAVGSTSLESWVETRSKLEGSTYVRRVSLQSGDCDQVVFDVDIDWKTKNGLLKASFQAAQKNPTATYDLGLGTIERGVNRPNLYEVPAQQWADLSTPGGKAGLAILTRGKIGWDRPSANTLRLTLLHTADGKGHWGFQETNDLGRHQVRFVLKPHAGDWRNGVARAAAALNQPMLAFATESHPGRLGRSSSLASVSNPSVEIKALKKSEDSNEIVVRLYEGSGKSVKGASLAAIRDIRGVRELQGDEQPWAGPKLPVRIQKGQLVFDMAPYRPRTFALTLAGPATPATPVARKSVSLPYTDSAVDGAIDPLGRRIPKRLWPTKVVSGGVGFDLEASSKPNVVRCSGQRIALPRGRFDRVSLLVAADGPDVQSSLGVGKESRPFTAPSSTGWVGQWWSRMVNGKFDPDPAHLVPPIMKRTPVAWIATHTNKPDGKFDAYRMAYLFRIDVPIKPGTPWITLPRDRNVLVFAASAWSGPAPVVPGTPLYW